MKTLALISWLTGVALLALGSTGAGILWCTAASWCLLPGLWSDEEDEE